MKEGDFISITDGFGMLLGRVEKIVSFDTAEILTILQIETDGRLVYGETILTYDLRRVEYDSMKVYENYEEFIEENFTLLL